MIQKLLALARDNSVFRPGSPFKIWYNSFAGIFDLEKSCTKCKWMKLTRKVKNIVFDSNVGRNSHLQGCINYAMTRTETTSNCKGRGCGFNRIAEKTCSVVQRPDILIIDPKNLQQRGQGQEPGDAFGKVC